MALPPVKNSRYGDLGDYAFTSYWPNHLFFLDKVVRQDYETLIKCIKSFSLEEVDFEICLLYTSPSPRDLSTSRMPSSA